MTLALAVNYGARAEITRAVRQIALDAPPVRSILAQLMTIWWLPTSIPPVFPILSL